MRRVGAAALPSVHRRDTAAGIHFTAQQRRLRARSTCPKRWGRAVRSSTSTATAGRTSCSSTRATGRGSRRAVVSGAVSQQQERHVHRRHAAGGAGGRDVRPGRRGGGLRQRRLDRHLRHGARAAISCSTTCGNGKFEDVTARGRCRRSAASRPARPGSTTTGTASSICSSPTTCSGRRQGSVLHARRQDEVVLHAGVVQGPEPDALPQQAATARSRTSPGRPGCTIRRPRALGVALIDYNNDGWIDLFVANDTQPNRLYRNTGKGTFTDVGGDRRRRVQRGGRRARRHGRRCRRLRRLRAARA